MTSKKISAALLKIKTCRKNGFHTEALLRTYHLNLELIRYLLAKTTQGENLADKKGKELVRELLESIDKHPSLKTLITKKSVKTLRPWLDKMDDFFKSLKSRPPHSLSNLQAETEKILALLNISLKKLLVKS